MSVKRSLRASCPKVTRPGADWPERVVSSAALGRMARFWLLSPIVMAAGRERGKGRGRVLLNVKFSNKVKEGPTLI